MGGTGGPVQDTPYPPPGSGPAAGGCAFGRLRSSASQAKRPHPWGLDGAIHGANGPAKAHPSRLSGFLRARTGRAESRARAKAKRQPMAAFSVSASVESGSDPFAQQRALAPAFDPDFAHPSAAGRLEGSGGGGGGGGGAYPPPPPPPPLPPPPPPPPPPPSPRHEAQRGNALNLTAPRKYPPRPCRCRYTWSPCRISAGDDAGRAAASRCGSRRSHPADGPGRSRRPAG